MNTYIFDITVRPTENRAEVRLNNQPISSQSQLWRCETEPFLNWVRDLAAMLFSELNNSYNLHFTGSNLECKIISGIFDHDPYCTSVSCSVDAGRYSIEQRITWATQASNELHIALPTKQQLGISAKVSCRHALSEALNKIHGVRSGLFLDGGQEVYVTDDANDIAAFNNYKVVYLFSSGQVRFDNSESRCLLFRGRKEDLSGFLAQILDLCILKPFMEDCYRLMSPFSANAAFATQAKVEMLRSEIPHARLILSTQRVEIGKTVTFSVDKFPDEKLNLNIHEANVLQMSGSSVFKAVGTGIAHIDIVFGNQKIWDGSIEVYKVNRVTSIQLTPPAGNILLHSIFQVQYALQPANAQNISKAKWTFAPVGSLKDLGNGRFEALQSGPCVITLSVEGVRKDVSLKILQTVRDIQVPADVSVKLNHGGVPVSITMLPVGSVCSSLAIMSLEPGIALWDDVRREVRPVSEGDADLLIRALDDNGNDLARKQVTVHVLPEKDIVTMPFIPTVIAALILVSVICFGTPLLLLSTGLGAVLGIAWLVGKWKYGILQFSPRRAKYETLSALLSIVLSLSLMAYHLYVYYYF